MRLLFALTLLLAACNQEVEYERLNVDDDCLTVILSPDEAGDDDDSAAGDDDDSAAGDDDDASDVQTIELHGQPGFFDRDVIGTASITPTRGPAVTTRFFLSVALTDTGNATGNPVEATDRATVIVDNGSVSLAEFDLDASPADPARWAIELGSGGDPDVTRRTDLLCVALYAEIE
jgi:hypothetical protein